MRLKEKVRDGARVSKRYHKPQTPYAMLIQSPHIDTATKTRLRRRYEKLNPAELKRKIDAIQRKLDRMGPRIPRAQPEPATTER
jgi:hypothetical protein